jgi:poly-gamma-glutamate capsule biosynthesis protein CapA/YwtB (metallophosphatase superfamily)
LLGAAHTLQAQAVSAQATVPDTALDRSVRICAGGDVLLGNNLDTLWAERASLRVGEPVAPFPDPDYLLEPLRPLVGDADIVLLNIEGAIGEGPAPSKCRPGSTTCYAFRQPVEVAGALGRFAQPAAVVGNVANNHAMDAGLDGFIATTRHLYNAGVGVTGVDTLATLVITSAGRDTVAVLGFSTFRAGADARDLDAVRRHVARAFAQYRRVVVSVHLGAEGRGADRTRNETEAFLGENRGNPVAFARTAVESGAALVIGHGPHVLRAAEWRGDALVFYSLGNLLTYGPFNQREPNSRGGIACAALDLAGRVTNAVLKSTYQRPPGIADSDLSSRGSFLVDSLSQLDFPESGGRVLTDGRVVRR